MKKFFRRLFGRTIHFGDNIRNFVCVLNSNKKNDDELYFGFISSVNFDKRELTISSTIEGVFPKKIVIPFDDIVTVSRMRDSRLRMWIKVKED